MSEDVEVVLLVLLEVGLGLEVPEAQVDELRPRALLTEEDAHVLVVEVPVGYARLVHALHGVAHLLKDVL